MKQAQIQRQATRRDSRRYDALTTETRPGKTAEPFAVVTEGRFPR